MCTCVEANRVVITPMNGRVFVVAGSGAVAIVAGLQNECAARIQFGSAGGE